MKRDMDLVRLILLQIEAEPSTRRSVEIERGDHTAEEIGYHIRLLKEAGLVRATDVTTMGGPETWLATSLTWEGHEFLDACRDPGRWEKAKALIREKAGVVGFELVKTLLIDLARGSLGL